MKVDLMNGVSYSNLFNSYGGTNQISSIKKLSEDIIFLLKQERGRFYPDPDFGSNLNSLLFSPMTEETGNLIKEDVVNTINRYYPQLIIEDVNVTLNENYISININYSYSDGSASDEINLELFNKI